jgi:hypothetical protein
MLNNILDFITGKTKRAKQDAETDKYTQYWDIMRQRNAAGLPIPNTKNPSVSLQNNMMGITPSPKAGLGAVADKIYGFMNPIINPISEVQASSDTNTIAPSPTVTPTPAPIVPQKIDFTGYTSKTLPEGKLPEVPTQDLTDMFFKEFGPQNEATSAAAVTVGENAKFNPKAIGQNYDEFGNPTSKDYGLMQVNDATFRGLLTRPVWKDRMKKEFGFDENTSPDVLLDPETNMRVAKMIRRDENEAGTTPWNRWYGWQNPPLGKGINLQEMIKKLKNK